MNYQKIYNDIIQYRKIHVLKKMGDGAVETHHIIPICMGGTDLKENKVNLYCREHYISHLLLYKIYGKFELLTAVTRMRCYTKKQKRKIKFNSHLYEKLRIRRAKEFSKYYQSFDEQKKIEIRNKISNSKKGKKPGSFGKILVSNEQIGSQKFINRDEIDTFLKNGFKLGQLDKNKKERSYCNGRLKIHKGNIIKTIKTELLKEFLDKGYSLGTGYKNQNVYIKGKKYIHNIDTGEISHIQKEEPIPDGWVAGRGIGKKLQCIWITNDTTLENKRIHASEQIPNGWRIGRHMPKKLYVGRKGTINKMWINNGFKRMYVDKSFKIPNGWKRGYKLNK